MRSGRAGSSRPGMQFPKTMAKMAAESSPTSTSRASGTSPRRSRWRFRLVTGENIDKFTAYGRNEEPGT